MPHANTDLCDIVEYLGLDIPFEIRLLSRKHKDQSAAYWALYKDGGNGKLHKHLIKVYLGNQDNPNERSVETLIAHELIHAWQEEMGHKDIHGDSFQKMARELGAYLGIPNLYDPETDK